MALTKINILERYGFVKITNEWVNVSHSIGAPFGAIGTGYGVYGKYGFVRQNFNSTPDAPLV